MLPTLPILRYDSQIHMTAPRLLAFAKKFAKNLSVTTIPKQKSTSHQRFRPLVGTNTLDTPTRFSEHIDAAMQNYLFSDEIHKQSTNIAAIEWKKAIADIVNQTTSLSDDDQLMQLMKFTEFIKNLSDDALIRLLNQDLPETTLPVPNSPLSPKIE